MFVLKVKNSKKDYVKVFQSEDIKDVVHMQGKYDESKYETKCFYVKEYEITFHPLHDGQISYSFNKEK